MAGHGAKGFVSSLYDALRANVDPGTGGHLAIHHQAFFIQFVEMFPVAPIWNKVGICDDYPWCSRMSFEDPHGFAALHQQCFISLQSRQCFHNFVIARPVSCSAADAAVDHQRFRMFCHLGVKVIHQHAQRRFGLPAFRGELCARCRLDMSRSVQPVVHVKTFAAVFACLIVKVYL